MERSIKGSAIRVLVVVACSIFISEFFVMILLPLLPNLPVWVEALIDSNLLIIMVLPLLYVFLFRPFVVQIEQRERAETKLKGEKDRVQQYLDVAGVMLLVLDRDGAVTLINRKGLSILARSEGEVVGKNWFDDFVSTENRESAREHFRKLFTGQAQVTEYFESSVLKKDARERTIAWHNTALMDKDGSLISILRSGEDITDRNRAEEALRAAHHDLEERVNARTRELRAAKERLEKEFVEHKLSDEALEETELRFKSVTMSANDAIIAADSSDTIISWNKGAENIFGYNESEAVGSELTMIMPEEYREAHLAGFERVCRTGLSDVVGKTIELKGLKKDGSEFPIELSIATWKTGKGIFYSGIIRDITIRKQIEEEKENIQAQLLHSQKLEAIGRLIVGVAHDFSNIILSIKGYSYSTMKRLDEGDPLRENMEKVQLLVERGSKVTQQLLVFGRKQPITFSEVDINSTIDGLLKLIDNLIRSDIKVTAMLEPELWRVRADSGNIEQLLMNLIVNANDAMPDGGSFFIRTENVEFDEESSKHVTEARSGNFVCVEVTDSGVGMDQTIADRIFDPFFTTKGKEGSGLGLSVVYGIVNRHGGWINVSSEPGEGARFTFFLPALTHDGVKGLSDSIEEENKDGQV